MDYVTLFENEGSQNQDNEGICDNLEICILVNNQTYSVPFGLTHAGQLQQQI